MALSTSPELHLQKDRREGTTKSTPRGKRRALPTPQGDNSTLPPTPDAERWESNGQSPVAQAWGAPRRLRPKPALPGAPSKWLPQNTQTHLKPWLPHCLVRGREIISLWNTVCSEPPDCTAKRAHEIAWFIGKQGHEGNGLLDSLYHLRGSDLIFSYTHA